MTLAPAQGRRFILPPACAPSLQMDFKVSITQPLAEHGEWAEKDYNPLESEFMEKLKKNGQWHVEVY